MIEALLPILSASGHSLDNAAADRLELYFDLLREWNRKIDLTNVPEEDMASVHFADSLLPLFHEGWFPFGCSLIDVGTGAGFPGMAIAAARGDMRVTLLDSLQKRCDFLEEVKDKLGLRNVDVLHARAEDAARGALRARFDRAAARAVAPLPVLCEYLLPFVKTGGMALCWKGPQVLNELENAARAAALLGGKMGETVRVPLAGTEHYVQEIHKQTHTPAAYPRRAGTPAKKPLGGA